MKPPAKSDQLKAWMREQGIFRTHQVIAWGLEHFYNRALRVKGQFHHDGLIRQLSEEEVAERGLPATKEAWYIWIGDSVHSDNGQFLLGICS